MGRGNSDLEGKARLSLADASSLCKPDPLAAGSLVRVIPSRDPWLRQYTGMRGRVRGDDGLIVEVLLPCGQLMSFWRNEVEPLTGSTGSRVYEGSEEPLKLLVKYGSVSGGSLQGQRHRVGVTQAAIATVMGVSVPRISQIEAAPAVRTVTAARYLEALRLARLSAA